MRIILLSACNALLLAIGQIMWKKAVAGMNIISVKSLFFSLTQPLVLSGAGIYVMATCLWIYILSRSDINYVYPIQSLTFLFVAIAATTFLEETVPLNRWVGIFIILVGVLISSMK
jgi:uncharacterized membrane protein